MVPGIEAAKTTTSRWAMKGYGGRSRCHEEYVRRRSCPAAPDLCCAVHDRRTLLGPFRSSDRAEREAATQSLQRHLACWPRLRDVGPETLGAWERRCQHLARPGVGVERPRVNQAECHDNQRPLCGLGIMPAWLVKALVAAVCGAGRSA